MVRWLLLIVALVVGWLWWPEREIAHPPGALAVQPPQQAVLTGPLPALAAKGYRVEPLARFALEARVLGTSRYYFDRGATLAPVDLALGWGRMSDTAVLQKISISQSGRFYFWRAAEFPIPRREIETSSANMHMVPANESVARQIRGARPGNVVKLSGYLIEARAADGWRWRSSLTREDVGEGACELVWVERIEVR